MTIEVTAKKIDDAIQQGLKQLGASLDEVNVEVVEAGGLFRKAKVRLTLERESEEQSATPVEQTEPVAKASAPTAENVGAATSVEVKTEKAKPEVKAQPKSDNSKNVSAPNANDRSAKKGVPSQNGVKQDRKDKSDGAKSRARQDVSQKVEADTEKSKTESSECTDGKSPVSPKDDASQQDVRSQQDRRTDAGKPRKLTEEDRAAAAHALEFVKNVAEKMGFADLKVEADENCELIRITAPAGDDSLLIGRHGETLSAISYLAEMCARAEKSHIGITVDCNGYRDRRAASLTAMAKRKAGECVAKHRKIKLEPMERIDRRTIHNALTDDDRVSTASEGKEPYRCVVIMPKK